MVGKGGGEGGHFGELYYLRQLILYIVTENTIGIEFLPWNWTPRDIYIVLQECY